MITCNIFCKVYVFWRLYSAVIIARNVSTKFGSLFTVAMHEFRLQWVCHKPPSIQCMKSLKESGFWSVKKIVRVCGDFEVQEWPSSHPSCLCNGLCWIWVSLCGPYIDCDGTSISFDDGALSQFLCSVVFNVCGKKYIVFEGDLTLAGRKEQVCCLNPGVTDWI